VLDSAYAPLRLSGSPLYPAEPLPAAWQLHTPNKALGLTGVRAAYAIAPLDADEDVLALEQLCPTWPVGAHGVALLQAWTHPATQAWLTHSRATLRDWKAQQIALCTSLGWSCRPSDANFFCTQPTLPRALTLAQALGELRAAGFKLRDTTSFHLPGLVRLGVLPPPAQTALKAAWHRLLKTSQ
jgi:histidinol-phosphate aminotransferase